MKKELLIIGESEHRISYEHRDEMFDKIAGLPVELRKLINMSKSLGAMNGNPMAGGYESSVVIGNGDAAYDTAAEVYAAIQVAAGNVARVWEMTVPPRYLYTWGSGMFGAINNQGYAFFAVLDAATAFQVGIVRLAVESYDRMRKKVVKAFNDAEAHLADVTTLATATPTNNQTGMVAIPQTTIIAAPYSRLAIDYQVITNVGAGLDAAGFRMPVTVKSS